jgi:ABC-type phosphate transport system permease subunit
MLTDSSQTGSGPTNPNRNLDADAFTLRRRPPSEKLIDLGFRQLTLVLASAVAIVLLGIFLTVFQGAREAISSFGLSFLTTSSWDPVNEQYGAFIAIYGTLVTSILSLAIAIPLGVGTAIFALATGPVLAVTLPPAVARLGTQLRHPIDIDIDIASAGL